MVNLRLVLVVVDVEDTVVVGVILIAGAPGRKLCSVPGPFFAKFCSKTRVFWRNLLVY